MDAFYGEIRAFAFAYAPQGWVYCWGNPLSVAQNQVLFSVIGTTYGGDGQTTFNVPDMRGYAPMHAGSAAQGPTVTVAETIGEPAVTLIENQMAAHNHIANGVQALAGQKVANIPSPTTYPSLPRYTATNTTYDAWSASSQTTTFHPAALGAAGGTDSHSNISPFLAMNFCICVDGAEYPQRP